MLTETSEKSVGEELLVATFLLGENTFGMNATTIQEVVMVGELTLVHHAPEYLAGIRNLRGRIITVIDLRIRLDLAVTDLGPENRILITEWKGESVGLLVDAVADTITVESGALESPPPNLHGVQRRHLLGVFRSGERLAGLLDPESILDPQDRAGSLSPDEMRL